MTSPTELDPEAVRIGATIKSLREAYGWKLGQMAAAIGYSHSYLSNIEAGRKAAPRSLCSHIAQVLRIPLVAIVSADYVFEVREGDEATGETVSVESGQIVHRLDGQLTSVIEDIPEGADLAEMARARARSSGAV